MAALAMTGWLLLLLLLPRAQLLGEATSVSKGMDLYYTGDWGWLTLVIDMQRVCLMCVQNINVCRYRLVMLKRH